MKISIVTAAFNSESTLVDTLTSIKRQEFNEWEHWIVDGASNDGTREVVERFSNDNRFLISEPDTGIYNAMNKGIARATGEVIGFLNADDFYESEGVLATISAVFEDPTVDLVYGNLRYVSAEDPRRVVRDWKSEPYVQGMFTRGWVPPHPTVYARRRVFEIFGTFDESFSICADWEWLFRVMELGGVKTRFLDEYLVRMRLGGVSNRSWKNVMKGNRETARAFRKHDKRVPLLFFAGKFANRGMQFCRALARNEK